MTMNKLSAFIILVLVAIAFPVKVYAEGNQPEPPALQAEAALLMEAQSGQILFSKNPDQPMYPASITKILTGIIAIESGKLEEIVTVSEKAVQTGGSSVYLEVGEQKPLRDLVYGALVNSGNDAAVAIAEHLGGSVTGFARMMNEKASELGATGSHFVNPSGMPDDDHVTTARDMALITRYAMQNETFREVVGTKEYPWEGESWQPGEIVNHNRLLWDYEGATGVKNGYTKAAQQTFVATSERDGQQLIAVCLKVPGSPKDMYRDLMSLMDYGYDAFETHRVVLDTEPLNDLRVAGTDMTGQLESEAYDVTLPKGTAPEALEQEVVLNSDLAPPIDRGDPIGAIRLLLNDQLIREVPFTTTTPVTLPSQPENKPKPERAEFPWLAWLISLFILAWGLFYFRRQHVRRQKMRARFRAYRSYRN